MLEFFRKYQRYFFLVIAVVIIISFSFFGTYSTYNVDRMREGVAFTAVDGTPIKRSELDDVVAFIATDSQDKLQFGGMWGPNFFNDGVIKKDFFETGLAQILASQYRTELEPDFISRFEKEKRYVPYTHPQAKFISVENSWSLFAPGLKADFEALRLSKDPLDPAAFEARVNLYLGQSKIPPSFLNQVLRYQQSQHTWVSPDPFLERSDLSLFGYHTLEDWFGPRFVRILAQFIINSALVAESKGYEVSKEEVLADLIRNAEVSYQQNLRNPNLGVANSTEYFNEQLRRMGMDQGRVIRAWRQVLLFRRLFGDVGNSVVVDPLAFNQYQAFAQESVQGELFSLPKDLQLGSFADLQKLELYLNAVSSRPEDTKGLLMPPKSYFSAAEVAKKYPELVQKRYLLDVAHIDKNALQSKVSVKEIWNWEVQDSNWKQLKEKFPELGIKKGETREERLSALDSLDDRTRGRVDAFATIAIIESHPDWIESAVKEAPMQEMAVSLRAKGGASPFEGLEDREKLMKLLDQAKLGDEVSKLQNFTAYFTADNKNYYRIKVLNRTPDQEIMTFAEADEEGVLDQLLSKALQNQNPEEYFAAILNAIKQDYTQTMPEKSEAQLTNDLLASLRFFAYMRDTKKKMEKNPEAVAELSRPSQESQKQFNLREPLGDQWKLVRKPYKATRSGERELLNHHDIFNLATGSWSTVYTYPNGDIYFVEIASKGVDKGETQEKIEEIHQAISDEAQRHYMRNLTALLKEKNAISLDYLTQHSEEIMEEPVQTDE